MSNPNALLLLADHIKLSLLEQKRAKTLNLRRDSQDGHISRSLDQFREGLELLEKEQQRLQEAGDEAYALRRLVSCRNEPPALTTPQQSLQPRRHPRVPAQATRRPLLAVPRPRLNSHRLNAHPPQRSLLSSRLCPRSVLPHRAASRPEESRPLLLPFHRPRIPNKSLKPQQQPPLSLPRRPGCG